MKKKILSFLLTPALFLGMIPALMLPASADDAAQPDNTALAAAYHEATKDQHPNVLFTEDDLADLRAKTKDGVSQSAYKALESLANSYKGMASAPYRFVGSSISGRALQLHLTTLAFYGQMKGKIDGKVYIDKAKAILLSAVEQGDLDTCYKDNAQLAIGDFATAFAIGYDWLYDYMTEAEREKVKARLMEFGEWIYVASTTGTEPLVGGDRAHAYWAEDNPTRSAWNWNTVIHTGLTLISMVTGEHPEWMARGLDRIEDYFTYSKNEAGMPQEGLSYTGYGMRIAIVIESSLVKHTGVSLVDRYEDLQNYMNYYTWAQLPKTGSGAIDTNQSNGLGNISIPFYLANRYKSEETLWAILTGNHLMEGGIGQLTQGWAGDSFDLPQLIVFEDKSLKPKEPAAGGLYDFAGQEVIMRSGFSYQNSAVHSLASVRVGAMYSSIWHHPDSGSVTFHAFDQSFLIDLGAGKRDVAQHNGMIYGGNGPKTTTDASLSEAREVAEGAYMTTVDLLGAYGGGIKADTVTRTVIYVDGNSPYVFIYDNVDTKAGLDATANWYTKSSNKISETENGLRITGTGDAVCDVYLFDEAGEGSLAAGAGGAFTTKVPKNRGFRIGHVFAASASADKAPTVEGMYDENGVLTLTITYKDAEGKQQTDTIVASDEGVVYQSTARETIEEPTTATETESVTETTTEETTAVITDSETETEVTEVTTAEPVESNNGIETEKPTESGCASTVGAGAAVLSATATACGVIAGKKKKKED